LFLSKFLGIIPLKTPFKAGVLLSNNAIKQDSFWNGCDNKQPSDDQ